MIQALAILLIGTLFFSALLTPVIYSGLSWIFPEFPWPFSRVFDRVMMVVAGVFLLLYWKEFNLSDVRRYLKGKSLGDRCVDLILGFGASLLPSLVILALIVGDGQLVWADKSSDFYLGKAPGLLLTGIVVSLLEEGFFRVVLLNKLRLHLRPLFAISVTSALYAFVHFIAPVKSFTYSEFSWSAGFSYLIAVVERLAMPGVMEAMVGLFIVGLVLAGVIIRSSSIYLCIGLHAGWIVAAKLSLFSTQAAPGFSFSSGVGQRYFLVADPRAWCAIILVGLLMSLIIRFRYPLKRIENREEGIQAGFKL